MALATVRDLLAETGHSLTPDDYGVLARLDSLARAIDQPTDPDEQRLLNLPVAVGQHLLRQPSLGKLKWFEDCALVWWDDDSWKLDVALGYVCSLDHTEEALVELAEQPSAEKAVKRWWRSLKVSPEAFRAKLRKVVPFGEAEEDGDEGPNRYGPTIALLTREYGRDPDYWMWTAHLGLAQAMLADYDQRMEAEARAARKARSGSQSRPGRGGTPQPVAPPATPRLHAQKRYRQYKNALRTKWQKTKPRSSSQATAA